MASKVAVPQSQREAAASPAELVPSDVNLVVKVRFRACCWTASLRNNCGPRCFFVIVVVSVPGSRLPVGRRRGVALALGAAWKPHPEQPDGLPPRVTRSTSSDAMVIRRYWIVRQGRRCSGESEAGTGMQPCSRDRDCLVGGAGAARKTRAQPPCAPFFCFRSVKAKMLSPLHHTRVLVNGSGEPLLTMRRDILSKKQPLPWRLYRGASHRYAMDSRASIRTHMGATYHHHRWPTTS